MGTENKNTDKIPGAAGGDPMASAIKRAGDGASPAEIAQSAKNAEARQIQEGIERDAVARNAAISDDERQTLAKMTNDREEREKLRPRAPVIRATSAERARPGEKTVTMIFPKTMFIWAEPNEKSGRFKVEFAKGVQQVPESLADDWYLKASGVKPYDGGSTADGAIETGPTVEEWVAAGYPASKYPPPGCTSRSTPEAIQALVDKERTA